MHRRHAEDHKESARALGFGPYVSEMAYRPNAFDARAGELSRDDREAYAKAHGRDWPKPATARCLTITLAQAEAAAWARITPAEILFTDPRPIYCRGCGERGTWSDDADLCRECERERRAAQHADVEAFIDASPF